MKNSQWSINYKRHIQYQSDYHKAYYLKHGAKIRRSARRYYGSAKNTARYKLNKLKWLKRNKDRIYEYGKKSREKILKTRIGRIKKNARTALQKVVRIGAIVPPRNCDLCGIFCKTQAHHHKGYSRKERLNVIWLCTKCHKRCHS